MSTKNTEWMGSFFQNTSRRKAVADHQPAFVKCVFSQEPRVRKGLSVSEGERTSSLCVAETKGCEYKGFLCLTRP